METCGAVAMEEVLLGRKMSLICSNVSGSDVMLIYINVLALALVIMYSA